MKRFIVVLAAATAAFWAGGARADEPSPKDVVVTIYHIAAGPKGDYQVPSAIDDKRVQKYLTKSLIAARNAMDARSKTLNEPILDFDPVTNSQDPSVRNLAIDVESADPAKTVVAARFDSEGAAAQNIVRYVFVREAGGWKLDDIAGENGPDKWDLREVMSPTAK